MHATTSAANGGLHIPDEVIIIQHTVVVAEESGIGNLVSEVVSDVIHCPQVECGTMLQHLWCEAVLVGGVGDCLC